METFPTAELEQRRILKTAIPGPRSLELMARKTGAFPMPGRAFTVGKHKMLAGWKEDTSLGRTLFSVTGKVKNVSDATSTAFISLQVHQRIW